MKIKTKKFLSSFLKVIGILTLLAGNFETALTAKAEDMASFERKHYLHDEGSPMDLEPSIITLMPREIQTDDKNFSLCLDGTWKMLYDVDIADALAGKAWDKAIKAPVPASIYTALINAGIIEDPYMGKNMVDANAFSSKDYYLQTTFTYAGNGKNVELDFDGLCNVADIYLNGQKIASHEGMFGGPWIDVSGTIQKGENTLLVHLKPAKDFNQTVVFNCSYGWHYARLWPLGIWQSVNVRDVPDVEIDSPFISTVDYQKGTVDLSIDLKHKGITSLNGTLRGMISPKNFEGKSYTFSVDVSGNKTDKSTVRLRTNIPDVRLWWPAGYGEQNLYTLNVTFTSKSGSSHSISSDFGIRQLDFEPFPDGAKETVYNRTCIINGKKIYFKGAGWCTIDAMMRFSAEDYDRILSRAHEAGINYFRSWGGGLVETEEFYDLCDKYGICIYQEWPCCWDSSRNQPEDVLCETVVYNTKRLRNRASLVVWGGGNEGHALYDDLTLNKMGKLTYELDGTRPFWRQDGGIGGGGIIHDHIHWGGETPEHYLMKYANSKCLNLTEYGLDSMMNLDSIAKFAKAEEIAQWPIDQRGTIAYHTSTFNGMTGWMPSPHGHDLATYTHYANMFADVDSLEDLIMGSQLAQAFAHYLPAQNARINFPYSTANVVYKMNDVAPHSTWAIVDWYGAPKISFYLLKKAYKPLLAAGKFDCYNTFTADGVNAAMDIPIYILDDIDILSSGANWNVKVTAYDNNLTTIKTENYTGKGSVNCLKQVGLFSLSSNETAHSPFIVTVDLYLGSELKTRTYTYMNFDSVPGSLFYLPRTDLEYSVNGDVVTVKNSGKLPAISVYFDVTDSAKFVCEDNYFFLESGEVRNIAVNDVSLIKGIKSFNLATPGDETAPSIPSGLTVTNLTYNSAILTWKPSTDDKAMFGYYLYMNDKQMAFMPDTKTSYTLTNLSEVTEYQVSLEAIDNNGNRSDKTQPYTFTTATNLNEPQLLSTLIDENGNITAIFDTKLNQKDAENVDFYKLNNGAVVEKAILADDGTTVTLTTTANDEDKTYTITLANLSPANRFQPVRMKHTEVLLCNGLYTYVDFTLNENGICTTDGKEIIPVEILAKGEITKEGVLNCAGQGGAVIQNSNFNFTDDCTVSFRYKGKAADNALSVLFAKGPKTQGHFEFYSNAGNLMFYAPEIGDRPFGVSMNIDSNWHTLTFVSQRDTLSVWIDGNKKGSIHLTGKVTPCSNAISFGCLNDTTLPYLGRIDDVSLYTRALSDKEIVKLHRKFTR